MPIINSFADVLRDWESLLAALMESHELETPLAAERLDLEKILAEARTLKAQQESQTASRQQLTQQIKSAVTRGRAVAISIRAVAKGKIGYRNERLVQFKVAPFRDRTRKVAPVIKPPIGGPTDEPVIETKKPTS